MVKKEEVKVIERNVLFYFTLCYDAFVCLREMKMILWLPLMMMMVALLMVVDIIILIAICCLLITIIKYGWSLCVCRRITRANEMIHLDVNDTRVTDLLDWVEFCWIREGKKAVNNSLARYPIIQNLCCLYMNANGEFIVCNMNRKSSMVMYIIAVTVTSFIAIFCLA